MQHEDSATLKARAARFKAEAKRPPPPTPKFWAPGLPTENVARATVFEHKVVKSDKDVALQKLIARKAKAGVSLTEDQKRALGSIGMSNANQEVRSGNSTNSSRQPRKPNSKPVVSAAPKSQPSSAAGQTVGAAERKLQKKIRECEGLEAVLATGKQLEANQIAKMQGKATLIAELQRLQVC